MGDFDVQDPKSIFPSSVAMQRLAEHVLRDDARALAEGLKAYPRGVTELGLHDIGLLLFATVNVKPNAVRVLMRAGADPHQPAARVANLGRPAALALRMNVKPDIFTVMIEEGLDLNGGKEGDGELLLVLAVMEPDDMRLRQILATGRANPNIADSVQATPLIRAVRATQYGKAMALLDAGADPGIGRRNVLLHLAEQKWVPGSPNDLMARQLAQRLRAMGLTESTQMLNAPVRPRGQRR